MLGYPENNSVGVVIYIRMMIAVINYRGMNINKIDMIMNRRDDFDGKNY